MPRTPAAEQAARDLMEQLGSLPEGKMFGVLLVPGGVLKAFSGLHGPQPGWVPTVEQAGSTPLEALTLARLAELKSQLGQIDLTVEDELQARSKFWAEAQDELIRRHREAKISRDHLRLQGARGLEADSRRDSAERRDFIRARQLELGPLQSALQSLRTRVQDLKRERRALSKTLQAELHKDFEHSLLQGRASFASLFPAGPPTGVGECCAPKLLHHAARQGLQPLGMAEFWWGPAPPGGGRESGQFYPACLERCQPLLGPLLSAALAPMQILYQDAEILAVNKPSGLLTVPGRTSANQDCLLHRLWAQNQELLPVHRLDLETSGVVVFARNRGVQAQLQRQFEARLVGKRYQAILEASPQKREGTVDLALGPDPDHPGRYRPDPEGKPAITDYTVVDGGRVELRPHTGRSHQLRIHMASGLNCPIRGDRLYGSAGGRLLLHASSLSLSHPKVEIRAPLPF